MCDSGIIKYNRTGKGNKKYECTKSYRHYSGWQRTLGESQGNAEKLWSCEGLCQSGDSLLFRSYLKKCIKLADKNKMRVRVIGEISAFDQNIQDSIVHLEEYSQKYDEIYFQIALNYGSRDEIVRGIRKLAQDAVDGKVKPEEIDEHVFDNYLDTAGIPDPDLMIRTSGELRLSNFLLWQMAYTEFYFTDVAWPDFNKAELVKAIEKYNQRDRRYGGVKEE